MQICFARVVEFDTTKHFEDPPVHLRIKALHNAVRLFSVLLFYRDCKLLIPFVPRCADAGVDMFSMHHTDHTRNDKQLMVGLQWDASLPLPYGVEKL